MLITFVGILVITITSTTTTTALSLTSVFKNRRRARMESVVRRYFDGVTKKDAKQIRSCFDDDATIHDVAISNKPKTVNSDLLVERCMEFVKAHPDCVVDFRYGPECSHKSNWVVAHWYEVGTWSGKSCGLEPTNKPMNCEGQTRFRVDAKNNKIQEFVVTRTFTDWENAMLLKRKEEEEKES